MCTVVYLISSWLVWSGKKIDCMYVICMVHVDLPNGPWTSSAKQTTSNKSLLSEFIYCIYIGLHFWFCHKLTLNCNLLFDANYYAKTSCEKFRPQSYVKTNLISYPSNENFTTSIIIMQIHSHFGVVHVKAHEIFWSWIMRSEVFEIFCLIFNIMRQFEDLGSWALDLGSLHLRSQNLRSVIL